MIEILPQSTETCISVHLSGKVNVQEYQEFLDAVNDKLTTTDEISLVLVLTGFEFYEDFEVAKKDLKFGLGAYKRVHRAALVGDQKWIGLLTRLVGPLTRAEEKHFAEGQFDAAFAWACG